MADPKPPTPAKPDPKASAAAAPGAKPGAPAAPGAKPAAPVVPIKIEIPPIAECKGKRIGQILTRMKAVTRDQVQEALMLQSQRRVPLGQLLIELGYTSQEHVNMALAAQAGMESAGDIERLEIPPEVIELLPSSTAKAYRLVPMAYDKESKTLTVAMMDPNNFQALDDLRILMGFKVKPMLANPQHVEKLLNRYYGDKEESLADVIGDLAEDHDLEALTGDRDGSIDITAALEAADDNRVKRLLNLVLMQAIKDKASDIHFEPFDDEFKMRYRIDGVLYEMIPPPKYLALPIVSRIKVMANLDISERRMPQDGRIELTAAGMPIDLRVAVLPTVFGESVVMRVLDRSNVSLDLEKVGLRSDDLDIVRQLINKPNGIVIVTGPTGSGKTTTLYAALNELNTIDTKILTAEDPVEYDIDGLCQVQVNPDVGLTFAAGLRSFLRQDPDIVLIGETRDLETARIGVQASLTGHLVFTTLHTNDAPSSIARLMDLGLETFLLTATLEGVVAQRLVRKICMRCREAIDPTHEQLLELELNADDLAGRQFYRGRGCDVCNHSGYKGRLGLFEIMTLDDEMRDMIMNSASTQFLRAAARKRGMRTLRESGLLAIYDGLTTVDEVVKETIDEEG